MGTIRRIWHSVQPYNLDKIWRPKWRTCSQLGAVKEAVTQLGEDMKNTITLTLKKSTKGTHVYENNDIGMTGVYIPKPIFGDLAENPPKEIKVTLEGK